MTTNIVISLDERREKKDGSYPLVMRLGHNKRTTSIPLGVSLFTKDWDEETRIVKKSYQGSGSVTRLNNTIQKTKSDAMDIIIKLNETGVLQNLSILDIKSRLVKKSASTSFFEYTNQQIEDLVTANRIGTARSYKGVVAVLKTFNNDRDLSFKEINYTFLTKLENWHLSKGNSYNSLSVYVRAIRAIFNKAIKEAIIEKDLYPFTDYKVKSVPTEKRALDIELLQAIIKREIPDNDICFNPRNYFVASYMMYGMNFTDMAYLKKSNLVDGRIQYRRRKTSKLYDIKVTPNLNTILQHYISLDENSVYIFPIVKREGALLQDKDIQWSRKRYNKKLKMLATLCGIEQNLTSYVSRHSFATQAMLQQVPLNAISTMLGHSSLKTTEIYLKSLSTSILDDYNAKILQ
jgi:integrase